MDKTSLVSLYQSFDPTMNGESVDADFFTPWKQFKISELFATKLNSTSSLEQNPAYNFRI